MQRGQTVRDVVILQIRTDLCDGLIDLPKIADHRERMDLIVRVSAVAVLVHADRHQHTLFVVEPDGLTADSKNGGQIRNGKRPFIRIPDTVRYVHILPPFCRVYLKTHDVTHLIPAASPLTCRCRPPQVFSAWADPICKKQA